MRYGLQLWTYGKGIVESGVKYVKNNFLPLRSFRDLADLNTQARQWVMQTAGTRHHGTTHMAPLALFGLERDVLSPLPGIAPDLGSWHRATVHRDCHVQFDKAFYSVSFKLVSQRLWLRATDCSVALYRDYEHLHTHPRALCRGQRVTVRDHLPPNAIAFFAHDRQWCVARAGEIGPACEALINGLLDDKVLERLRAAQNILRLAKTYGADRLNAACQRALDHERIGYG
ncbi:MAG: IS21 family transposase, partial [Burkholderiaceae bacterium]